ncbi:hypothetical protein ACTHPF_18315 [Paenibacillus sp. SAF-054]|uniref:hypothetical protein n=1 Tax=unclassified Paenibacillus TaxID=185978 RepID=UPI003F80ECB7
MKVTRWLVKTVLTVVLISGLTVLTTGAIVNSYVQSLLASFNITLEGQSLSLGGMMKGMLGFKSGSSADKTSGAGDTKESPETPDDKETSRSPETGAAGSLTGDSIDSTSGSSTSNSSGSGSANTETDESGASEKAGTGGTKPGNGEAPIDALPVMGQGLLGESAAGSQSAQDQQVVISPDDVAKKKQELTNSEKEQIFTILMTKLPQPEMQKISTAMEDGLTEQELQAIEDSIAQYLSTEEFNVLKQMLEQE